MYARLRHYVPSYYASLFATSVVYMHSEQLWIIKKCKLKLFQIVQIQCIFLYMEETDAGFQCLIIPLTERETHHNNAWRTRVKGRVAKHIKMIEYFRPRWILVSRKTLLMLITDTGSHAFTTHSYQYVLYSVLYVCYI